jgi:hypothetical protein
MIGTITIVIKDLLPLSLLIINMIRVYNRFIKNHTKIYIKVVRRGEAVSCFYLLKNLNLKKTL